MSSSPTRVRAAFVVVIAAFALGGLTSVAQSVLPDAISSLANSASGWTLATAVLVVILRPPVPAVVGASAFVALTCGYAVVSALRGFPYSPVFWAIVGVVAGPFVGFAAAWLRARGTRLVLGTALLAGIGIGEAVYGLTVVGDSTSPVYWILIALVGLGLVIRAIVVLRGSGLRILGVVVGTAGVGALFLGAYRLLGGVVV